MCDLLQNPEQEVNDRAETIMAEAEKMHIVAGLEAAGNLDWRGIEIESAKIIESVTEIVKYLREIETPEYCLFTAAARMQAENAGIKFEPRKETEEM